ncbi:LysR substrate-binding domain-containing protein [Primorskyibacter aestuariivivens]|uniref:LysR substrate-binding domain-containing protein n=1 Tax=Primorskyibacter aestuariivivens TaxID=1888912 RepID=UPI0022FFCF65|nr:LysR substrate-binding domain-containing protein [Primorskyibacter aestuariivivens]MDA7429376.1 LysR substrate-binding domain-containing protein [Primorskyibacter aestuariivivens]
MRFDLRHIRCFVAVAEELHFRRAAERLGIAQPALSRTIRDLENDLGVVLFERSNRFVEMTKAGHAFLEHGRRILSAVEFAVDNTRQVAEGKIGSLRIGYTDLAIIGNLSLLLRAFREAQPDIALEMRNEVSIQQLRDIDDDRLDIGFVTGPFNHAGYDQLTVSTEAFACVVYDSHPLAQRDSVHVSDLANEDFVHGTEAEWEVFYSHLLPMCHRNGFAPRIVQQATTTIGILGLVAAGVGITVLADNVGTAMPAGVKLLPIRKAGSALETVAIWKPDRMERPKRLFVDAMRAAKGETAKTAPIPARGTPQTTN